MIQTIKLLWDAEEYWDRLYDCLSRDCTLVHVASYGFNTEGLPGEVLTYLDLYKIPCKLLVGSMPSGKTLDLELKGTYEAFNEKIQNTLDLWKDWGFGENIEIRLLPGSHLKLVHFFYGEKSLVFMGGRNFTGSPAIDLSIATKDPTLTKQCTENFNQFWEQGERYERDGHLRAPLEGDL